MKSDEFLQNIARFIDQALSKFYGTQMGYALLVFSFDDKVNAGDYISNAQREDMVKALRECADRVEANQIIGTPIGEA